MVFQSCLNYWITELLELVNFIFFLMYDNACKVNEKFALDSLYRWQILNRRDPKTEKEAR